MFRFTTFLAVPMIALTMLVPEGMAQCTQTGCAAYPVQSYRYAQPVQYTTVRTGLFGRRRFVAVQPVACHSLTVAPAPVVQQAAPVQASPQAVVADVGGDADGFIAWLNSTRAAYGLQPVVYDQTLSDWAQLNNQQQAARGCGHFIFGPATRQNASFIPWPNTGPAWLSSPPHAAALLDPGISRCGIAWMGSISTFNAN